ncbi:cornifelin homolog B-like [Engraulis encrasicolus]|uniref:cornifelin homolog B-like n=1 Tax=Engraulis encrasicolus TaxID=184585 RepID=UPI002FD142B8
MTQWSAHLFGDISNNQIVLNLLAAKVVGMANKMVVTQPVGFNSTTMTTQSRQWSTGLFQCLDDMPSCCFNFWCLWCFMCKTSKDFGEPLCLPLVDICMGGVVKPVTLSMRAVMRRRYGIEMAREMQLRTPPATLHHHQNI